MVLDKKNHYHIVTFLIVFIGLLNEILSIYLSQIGCSIVINYDIYVLISFSLWIYLLYKIFKKKYYLILLLFFITYDLLNLFFIENTTKFNHTNFIIGAIIYLLFFIIESYNNLRKEKLDFFLSNNLILLSAPVLFFIGFSFMLAFKSKELTTYQIFNNIKLYTLLGNFVNIVYYTLINIYILKERKSKNG